MKKLYASIIGTAIIAACPSYSTADPITCAATCVNQCSSSCDNCKTIVLPFSQGEDRSRDYAGVAHLQNFTEEDDINMHSSVALEYNQSFKSSRLGAYLFPNGSNMITVGPDSNSGVDIRNIDLGLSPTFTGSLRINPRIQNVIFEPAFYIGFDKWVEGLFAWIKFPIVYSRWDLHCCETDTSLGGQYFPTDLMSQISNPVAVPTAGETNQIQQAFTGTTYGDKKYPLQNARIICCAAHKTGVADIPLHIGYNMYRRTHGYVGAYIRTVFPTGTQEHRNSIFDPTVGYRRWQLGAGLQAGSLIHTINDDSTVSLYADLYMTHIFKKEHCRVFDLTQNGCFSRYLLMQEVDQNGLYVGRLANFADVFTGSAKSQFDWNLDGLIFFNIKSKRWTTDIGYEIKARARETFTDCKNIKICNTCSVNACSQNSCSQSSCSTSCNSNNCNNQSTASIGSNQYGIKGLGDAGIAGQAITTYSNATIAAAGSPDAEPEFINAENFASLIDIESAQIPTAVSNKVWANLAYVWEDLKFPVFVGIGADVEFGNNTPALSIWSFRGRLGIAYN